MSLYTKLDQRGGVTRNTRDISFLKHAAVARCGANKRDFLKRFTKNGAYETGRKLLSFSEENTQPTPILYLKSAPAPIPRSLSGHILHPFAIMVYMRVTCAADVERASYNDLLDNLDDFPEVKAKYNRRNCSTSLKDLYLEYFREKDQENRVSFDHRLV